MIAPSRDGSSGFCPFLFAVNAAMGLNTGKQIFSMSAKRSISFLSDELGTQSAVLCFERLLQHFSRWKAWQIIFEINLNVCSWSILSSDMDGRRRQATQDLAPAKLWVVLLHWYVMTWTQELTHEICSSVALRWRFRLSVVCLLLVLQTWLHLWRLSSHGRRTGVRLFLTVALWTWNWILPS